MLKVLFVLFSITLIGHSIKHTRHSTQNTTLNHHNHFRPPKTDVLLDISQTNSSSPEPIFRTEFQNDNSPYKGNRIARDLFACPLGTTYLSFEDYKVYNICTMGNSTLPYRLQAGASATPPIDLDECFRNQSDARKLNMTACVHRSITSAIKNNEEGCPEGYSLISIEEVKRDQGKYCEMLDEWDIARIGFRGSIAGPGYKCELKEWNDNGTGHSICVQRSLDSIKLVNSDEGICQANMTLVTISEVMSDRLYFCNLIPYWGISRLAGGASLDGGGYGCRVRDLDRRSLGHAICGIRKRNPNNVTENIEGKGPSSINIE